MQQKEPSAFDRLREIASHYDAALPAEANDVYLAHLAIANCGAALTQTVESYLSLMFDINPGRYSVLRAIYFAEGRSLYQSQIAREIKVSSPNITQLIDVLERSGMVKRTVGVKDRRMTNVVLTEAGVRLCREMIPAVAELMTQTCAVFSQEELNQLVRLLEKFRLHLARPGESHLPSR